MKNHFQRTAREMLLYKFKAAMPWRVALTNDETGENLPAERGALAPGRLDAGR
jgi:hypothetical protein